MIGVDVKDAIFAKPSVYQLCLKFVESLLLYQKVIEKFVVTKTFFLVKALGCVNVKCNDTF